MHQIQTILSFKFESRIGNIFFLSYIFAVTIGCLFASMLSPEIKKERLRPVKLSDEYEILDPPAQIQNDVYCCPTHTTQLFLHYFIFGAEAVPNLTVKLPYLGTWTLRLRATFLKCVLFLI